MLKRPALLHIALRTNFSGNRTRSNVLHPRGLNIHPFTSTRLPSKNSPTANLPAIASGFQIRAEESVERPLTSSIR